jgi:hypothetical protein
MKIILTILFNIFFLHLKNNQSEAVTPETLKAHQEAIIKSEYELFVKALYMLESSGNPNAEGGANDVGLFQIIPDRLYNYNRRTGKNYSLNDRYNPEISREIFDFYAYQIGIENHEEIARRWNRASNWQDEKGAFYWKLVKKRLDKLKVR